MNVGLGRLKADALIYPINLGVEVAGCPQFWKRQPKKRHICNLINRGVVARVFLPEASQSNIAQLADVEEGKWREGRDFRDLTLDDCAEQPNCL